MSSFRLPLLLSGLLLFLAGTLLQPTPDRSSLSTPEEAPQPVEFQPITSSSTAPLPKEALVARILSADANDSEATEIQQIAFAALQKSLAPPTKESLLEKARHDPATYRAKSTANGGTAVLNPAHGFSAKFDADGGVRVRSTEGAGWSWRMEALDLPAAGPLVSDGPRVERSRGPAITEWYVNEDRGLEQFFTLNQAIALDEAGESRIRVAMETGLTPEMEGPDRIAFLDETGDPVLYYHQIEVVDATGARLPARMELETADTDETTVALVFDATGATYPVTVDPFVSTVLHRFPGFDNSNPTQFTPFLGSTFAFTADDGIHGTELWKSDGTAAGTEMVKDILPGEDDSSPDIIAVVPGLIFFTAEDDEHGEELWKSDLTEGGTELVKDINPGVADGARFAGEAVMLGSKLYFQGDDGTSGRELWSTDGTEVNTTRVKDINTAGDSSPNKLTKFGAHLFFAATGPNGNELWKTNGTELGTVEVADINTFASSNPNNLTVVNGALFFSAFEPTNGTELWRTNGTVVEMVKNIRPLGGSSSPGDFVEFGGELFFKAIDDTNGSELWKSNGTEAGTVMVKDIRSGATGSSPAQLAVAGGVLFFNAIDELNGQELWKSDGTESGTVLVTDLFPGDNGSSPNEIVPFGSGVAFRADDGSHGRELWFSDGTEPGTVLVKDLFPGNDADGDPESGGPEDLGVVDGVLYFNAYTDDLEGAELWASDGTEAGTMKLKNLNPRGELPEEIVHSGDRIYFSFDDLVHGIELWATDGTPGGTGLVKDIAPGETGSDLMYLTDVDGTLFFQADQFDVSGDELWKSNGTEAGTVLVKDIVPGTDDSSPENLTAVNGTLFFTADDDAHGEELWKSDGTAAGTVLVKDIRDGISGSNPDNLANLNGTLLFRATDGINGSEPWKSDGTEDGTEMVKDINPGGSSINSEPAVVSPELGLYFFVVEDNTVGTELWKSDGTEAGTELVKDIEDGMEASSFPTQLTAHGQLFFTAETTDEGRELWISDGTEAGTQLVKDINPDAADANIAQITPVGDPLIGASPEGALFFLADDGTSGLELWTTDGITTQMFLDLVPGMESGFTDESPLGASDGRFFYAGDDGSGTSGNELYLAETLGGPADLQEDLFPGSPGSFPSHLIDLNGQLVYFAVDDLGGFTLRSETGATTPDGKIGKNLGTLKGNDVYNTSGSGQKQTLVSKKLKKLKFHGMIENDGEVIDRVSLTGTKGNAKFKVNYFGPSGNITAQVTTIGHELTVPKDESKIFRVEVKPKSKLKNRKTGKIKRKKKTLNFTAKSTLDPTQLDTIQCQAKTR